MERFSLKVETREETGKGAARRLRRNGLVPAVVYGREQEPKSLKLNPLEIQDKLTGNVIFDIEMDDEEEKPVMIKEVQKEPVSRKILHIDFQYISMDEKITVSVPINLVGTAFGVQEGGVLQQLMREVEIESLPMDIPDQIDVDISELDLGRSLMISDLEVPENIEIKTPLDEVIVTIVAPTELVEEEIEEEDEDFIEPEVIGEEDEEGEEGGEEKEEEQPQYE